MSASLLEFSNALGLAVSESAASIVAVHTEHRGSSSGVVWRPGLIVTAEHALRNDEEIKVTLPDCRIVSATLAGRDTSTDLAVLKCQEATSAITQFGDVKLLKPGNLVVVVGQTRVSGSVVGLAVVSMVAGERRTWTGASLSPYIRLDVRLQPTGVGGAVIDAQGRAVGIATPRLTRFGITVVPAPTVGRVVATLSEKGHIPRAYLGVGLQAIRVPDALRQSLQRNEKSAVIALEVELDGPAHKAGIVIGDIFLSLDGHPIARLQDVQTHLSGESIGKTIAVKFVRGGAIQDASIVVGERSNGGD